MEVKQVATADKEIVMAFVHHLVKAYVEFIRTTDKDVQFLDGLMAGHNFFKWIILDIEGQIEDDEGIFRRLAIDTLEQALFPEEDGE